MSIARKISRRMAKAQMKKDGIQHLCRQLGVSVFGHAVAIGKTSYFASHWRKAAAKRYAELSRTQKSKPARRVRESARIGA